ncbi:FadR/GntR family transcriptional regulator [Paenibacillus sp. Marseille-Q4541]|uniref:FadR/GntR family transcriptional regulator n=1 Tax=Paenibacillus sp. Marseille-Q4541 TaxID=2831522 RepID=UPI001BA90FCD|nr:FadR/GntR family transcriptional regulator [Paenibacillus sp. Marseille-Q4541]
MLKKTSRQSLTEQIADQIEQLIESGEWPVGKRIPPEPQLMEELQVSRNTLREAIKALTHAGLLKTRQGDGTYVSASSALGPVLHKRVRKTDFIRSLEVRYALEREAAYLAADRRTKQDLEQIRSCLDHRNEAIRNEQYEAFAEWDVEFHRAIVAATRNDLLMDLYEHVTGALKEIVTEISVISGIDDHFQDTHEQLMRAIEEQDQARAVDAVHNYIEESKLHFIKHGGSSNEIN